MSTNAVSCCYYRHLSRRRASAQTLGWTLKCLFGIEFEFLMFSQFSRYCLVRKFFQRWLWWDHRVRNERVCTQNQTLLICFSYASIYSTLSCSIVKSLMKVYRHWDADYKNAISLSESSCVKEDLSPEFKVENSQLFLFLKSAKLYRSAYFRCHMAKKHQLPLGRIWLSENDAHWWTRGIQKLGTNLIQDQRPLLKKAAFQPLFSSPSKNLQGQD